MKPCSSGVALSFLSVNHDTLFWLHYVLGFDRRGLRYLCGWEGGTEASSN